MRRLLKWYLNLCMPPGLDSEWRRHYTIVIVVFSLIPAATMPNMLLYMTWEHPVKPLLVGSGICLELISVFAVVLLRFQRFVLATQVVIFCGIFVVCFLTFVCGQDLALLQYLMVIGAGNYMVYPRQLRQYSHSTNVAGLLALVFTLATAPRGPLYGEPFTGDFIENIQMSTMAVVYIFCAVFTVLSTRSRDDVTAAFELEHQRAEELLHNILPISVSERLKVQGEPIADGFESVTVLFADIVDFTEIAAKLRPEEVVAFLNEVFSHFDALVSERNLEKIKTIGDAYMAAAGIPVGMNDHAGAIADLALAMLTYCAATTSPVGTPLRIRIGINTGPVVAGVIGTKRFIYDLWGDTVNLASRLETTCPTSSIQVSDATFQLLKDRYRFEDRGQIAIKGRGHCQAWVLLAPAASTVAPESPAIAENLPVGA